MKPHGIMFHHFHSCKNKFSYHCKQQGSISAEDLEQILLYLKQNNYNILNANDFCFKYIQNQTSTNDVVLTFDDNLLCQYDIAKPILDKHEIKAIWFINTMTLNKQKINYLDIFRHFRNYSYNSIDEFYNDFFNESINVLDFDRKKTFSRFNPNTYLNECPFYSNNDKTFKFYRDELLTEIEYISIMFRLIKSKKYDWKQFSNKLWMNEDNIKNLSDEGHIIGMRSHSHSTYIDRLSKEEQFNDYKTNKSILEKITNKPIYCMSHPCGKYSKSSLEVLTDLNINIGFIDNMFFDYDNSNLLIPREDHTNIMKVVKAI